MTSNQKIVLLALGVLTLFLMVGQYALGQIMSTGDAMRVQLRTPHKHLGHTLLAVSVVFVLFSMWMAVNTPTRPRKSGRNPD